jgi:hypothetical protein
MIGVLYKQLGLLQLSQVKIPSILEQLEQFETEEQFLIIDSASI